MNARTNLNATARHFISLKTAAQFVVDFGDTETYLFRGEPGIGKSAILKSVEESLGPDYDYIYVDCPVFDVPDVGMALPNHEAKQLEFFVNALFKLTGPGAKRPKCIMLDELAKCRGPALLTFTRLVLEHVLAGIPLPAGSRVFATSNLSSDGVGDAFASHLINRLNVQDVRKSVYGEWELWAQDAGVDPDLISYCGQNATIFDSYTDGIAEHDFNENQKVTRPMIFNPSTPGVPYASPRSLAKASRVVATRDKYDHDTFVTNLAGLVGRPCAVHMASFFTMIGKLVSFERIVADPMNVPVNTNGATPIIQINNAVARINTEHELEQFLKFLDRMNRNDLKMLFFTKVTRTKRLGKIVGNNRTCLEWTASQKADSLI